MKALPTGHVGPSFSRCSPATYAHRTPFYTDICAAATGSYDHFLNFQICFIILLQLAMCIFCAVASYIWRQRAGYSHYQLAMDKYVQVRQCGLCTGT